MAKILHHDSDAVCISRRRAICPLTHQKEFSKNVSKDGSYKCSKMLSPTITDTRGLKTRTLRPHFIIHGHSKRMPCVHCSDAIENSNEDQTIPFINGTSKRCLCRKRISWIVLFDQNCKVESGSRLTSVLSVFKSKSVSVSECGMSGFDHAYGLRVPLHAP